MNLCILSGKVVNEIELKFIYNPIKKSIGKKHISVVQVVLELQNNQKVLLKAYNEMADWFYQHIKEGDNIVVEGKVRSNYIEVDYYKKQKYLKQ